MLIPQHKVLALLHMLSELLLVCQTFTDEELKKVIPTLQTCGYCALPVGAVATSVLCSVRSELAMRGTSMFQRLAREVPFMRSLSARDASAWQALTTAFTTALAVHVVLDEKSDWARAFRALNMASCTPHEEEEGARRALASMLYVLLKGAALGVSTAKLGTLSYAQILPLAAEACVLSGMLSGALGEATADEVAHVRAQASAHAGLKALATQIGALAEAAGPLTRAAASAGDSADDMRTARLPPLSLRELVAEASSSVSEI